MLALRRVSLPISLALLTSVSSFVPASATVGGPDDGIWNTVPANFTPPMPYTDVGSRQQHSMIFDSVGQRFILFGGIVPATSTYFGDVWQRAVGSTGPWTLMTVQGSAPSGRRGHSAIFDPIRNRMIVFGGEGGFGQNSELWQLSFTTNPPTWTLLSPSGGPPTSRYGHSAVYDPIRDRMVVFGGRIPAGYALDIWGLSLASNPPVWSAITTSGTVPVGRTNHVAIYDATHDLMVVYGGQGNSGGLFQDTWTLGLGATPSPWVRRLTTSPMGTGRQLASSVYDPTGDRMIYFGGQNQTSLTYYNDANELNLTTYTWSLLLAGGSVLPARAFTAMAFDPVNREAVIQGGATSGTLADTWKLAVAGSPAWTRLAIPPPPVIPVARRYGAAGIFDPSRQRYVMFGGANGGDPVAYLGDVDKLEVGVDSGWVSLAATGSAPSARYGHSMIYDPIRDRAIVFGGYGGSFLNDVWKLDFSSGPAWAPLAYSGTPPSARDFHTAIYDPVRDRMIVFGGNTPSGPFSTQILNDVWELTLGAAPTWTQLAPTGGPPPGRLAHGAIYDPIGDRMIAFGGFNGNDVTPTLNDLWALSLSGTPSWQPLSATGAQPLGRHSFTFQYDPARSRAVLYGGVYQKQSTSLEFDELWHLTLGGGTPHWTLLSPGGVGGVGPVRRFGQLGLIDPINDRMLVSGGYHNPTPGTLEDVWRLQWYSAPTAATTALLSVDARSDAVALRWGVQGADGAPVRVERNAGSDWRVLERRTLDGSDQLEFVDRDVRAGEHLGYRLVVEESTGETISATTWVDVPAGAVLALHGFEPNPASAGARIAFTLPGPGRATLELLDVSGRRVMRQDVSASAPGRGSVAIGAPLAPGLYFIRLEQNGHSLLRRGTVMR